MSDNEEIKKKKETINISIDRTPEVDSLYEENAELREKMKLIAHADFEEKCKSVGLDPEQATPEILKAELRKRAPVGGEGQPYWQNELGGKPEDPREKTDLGSILVDNTESGLKSSIEFLNWKKSHGTNEERLEASRLLGIAVKHQFSKNKTPLDIEFQGSLKDCLKHEIAIQPNWTDEEKAKAEELNRKIREKRTAWEQRD
jgi:hypothetical protein